MDGQTVEAVVDRAGNTLCHGFDGDDTGAEQAGHHQMDEIPVPQLGVPLRLLMLLHDHHLLRMNGSMAAVPGGRDLARWREAAREARSRCGKGGAVEAR